LQIPEQIPISQDREKRTAQQANLRPDAATRDGGCSEAKLAPVRERFAAELSEQFGWLTLSDEL
jgi:hypothetical protein